MRAEDATVGELIRLVDEGRLENAWILASEETDAAVRGLRARRLTDAEDSASESLVRIFDDGQSALRRADPDCPLRVWLRGVITNVLRETRQSQRERTNPAVVDAAATADAQRAKSRTEWGGGWIFGASRRSSGERSSFEHGGALGLRSHGLSGSAGARPATAWRRPCGG